MNKNFIRTLTIAIVQYYDYHLYGFLAASLSKNFFSHTDASSVSQLLKTYLVYVIGMFAKPIGSIFIGKIGDLYGRIKTLKISLLCNSLFTLIISITPTYNEIGSLAAYILIICRMNISVFSSTGTDGVRLYIYENIGKDRQCFGNGLVVAASQIGVIIASFSAWFFTLSEMPEYSWRIPFLIGSIFGILMTFNLSNFTAETAMYKGQNTSEARDLSIFNIIKDNFLLFLCCIVTAGSIGAVYQFNIIFFGTYCFEVLRIIDPSIMKIYTVLAIAVYLVSSIIAGVTADKYGRLLSVNIVYPILLILIFINSIHISNSQFQIFIYMATTALLPFMVVPSLAFLKQSIPINVRYRVFSLAHALGSCIISSTTAFTSTYIFHVTKISSLPLLYFGAIVTLIFLMSNILCYKFQANKV